MKKAYFSITALLLLFILFSCSFHAPVSDQSKPTFFIKVIAHDQHPEGDTNCIEIEGSAMGSPIPEVQEVSINDNVVPLTIEYGPDGILFESWAFPETITGLKTVSITYDNGTVYSTITIPKTTDTIISHSDYDTIMHNTDLTVSWSSDAEFFTVDIYTLDTNNTTEIFLRDSIIDQKNFTIPGHLIGADLLRIKFHIFGFNGVVIKPGAVANMEGDGYGFIVAQNYLGDWSERRLTLYFDNAVRYGEILKE